MSTSLPQLDFALGENAEMIRESTQRVSPPTRIAPLAAKIDADDWFPRDELVARDGRIRAFTALPWMRKMAASDLAISNMSSRSRRLAGPRPRLDCLMARTAIYASTRSAAGAIARAKSQISAQADFWRTCRQPCDV